jgi:hypothetical protein
MMVMLATCLSDMYACDDDDVFACVYSPLCIYHNHVHECIHI